MDKNLKDIVGRLQDVKKTFIAPKKKMEESIENDTRYLIALSGFIKSAEKMMKRYEKSGDDYNMNKIQLEIFDAVGKLQANQNLVNDKMLHYEKVFLPKYEHDMNEMKEKFDSILNHCRDVSTNNNTNNEDELKVIGFISKEIEVYDNSELKEDDEFKLHTYKILSRLYNKYNEIQLVDSSN